MMKSMSEPSHYLGLYLHLARASARRNRPQVNAKLMVLAGVVAARMGLQNVAAYCRHAVLQHNPGHMIRRWPTLADALEDSDFLHLLKQLQRQYPQEKAEELLASLNIEMAGERDTYYTDSEYAAALLGVSEESLEERFGTSS